jgi:hypothetical protein
LRVGCIRRHSNQGGRCNHHLDPNLCKIWYFSTVKIGKEIF